MNREQLDRVVNSVSGFSGQWAAFLSEWEAEGESPWYAGMSELAHYVVESYSDSRTNELTNLFSTIEDVLENVDLDVESLIAIGLFEDVQNIASHREFGATPFRQLLGPRSVKIWDEVDQGMKRVAQWAATQRGNKKFDVEKALSELESPELRKIIESLYRK